MMTETAQAPPILLVEDTLSLARVYQEYLTKAGHKVHLVETGEAALKAIGRQKPELILLDIELPGMSGMDVLHKLSEIGFPGSVIVITAHGSINLAVEAMKAGAFDFLVKPFNAERLLVTVKNALERNHLHKIIAFYEDDIVRDGFCGFIGRSLPMQAVYRTIDSAAHSKATVFITGESGTGKELCADAIHQRSPRADRPFIALNCAAIPRELMESELFGHKKGSFTGAVADRDGAAILAHKGTLFLDEICEMDLNLQSKLLRFLQTGQVQRVGDTHPVEVDVRIICASNRQPFEEVKAGRFREDLYYRLHVIPIHLPPLRKREADSLDIARHFLKIYSREEGKSFADLSPEVETAFLHYNWPGNIREVQNILRNIVVLHEGKQITADMLPPVLSQLSHTPADSPPNNHHHPAKSTTTLTPTQIEPLALSERRLIEAAITACDNNIPQAAKALQVSPSTLYRKIATWDSEAG